MLGCDLTVVVVEMAVVEMAVVCGAPLDADETFAGSGRVPFHEDTTILSRSNQFPFEPTLVTVRIWGSSDSPPA